MTGCTKRSYPTRGAAFFALGKIQRSLDARSAPKVPTGLHICKECHAWHLTSSAKPQVRAQLPKGS
jgi:hypothetical protein